MKKQILAVTALVAMVVFGSMNVEAAPIHKPGGPMNDERGPGGPGFEMQRPPGPGPERTFELMAVALDLNDTQKQQIQQILETERTKHRALEQAVRDEEQSLRRMFDTASFDEAAFRAASMKIAEKRVDMVVAGAKLKPQMLALLTPEQKAKAEQLFKLMGPPPRCDEKPF